MGRQQICQAPGAWSTRRQARPGARCQTRPGARRGRCRPGSTAGSSAEQAMGVPVDAVEPPPVRVNGGVAACEGGAPARPTSLGQRVPHQAGLPAVSVLSPTQTERRAAARSSPKKQRPARVAVRRGHPTGHAEAGSPAACTLGPPAACTVLEGASAAAGHAAASPAGVPRHPQALRAPGPRRRCCARRRRRARWRLASSSGGVTRWARLACCWRWPCRRCGHAAAGPAGASPAAAAASPAGHDLHAVGGGRAAAGHLVAGPCLGDGDAGVGAHVALVH